MATANLEVRRSENIPGCLFSNDSGQIILGREPRDHFGRAISPFIHEQDDLVVKWLGTQTLGKQEEGLVAECEPPKRPEKSHTGLRHRNGGQVLLLVPFAKTAWRQAVSSGDLAGTQITCKPCQSQATSYISTQINNEPIRPAFLQRFHHQIQGIGEPERCFGPVR